MIISWGFFCFVYSLLVTFCWAIQNTVVKLAQQRLISKWSDHCLPNFKLKLLNTFYMIHIDVDTEHTVQQCQASCNVSMHQRSCIAAILTICWVDSLSVLPLERGYLVVVDSLFKYLTGITNAPAVHQQAMKLFKLNTVDDLLAIWCLELAWLLLSIPYTSGPQPFLPHGPV